MCGIGGCIGDQANRELVREMSALIEHRGPDDHGEFVDKGVAIFSNRLSIIDLEGGHQPILNEKENLLIVFNGEIYNFIELRTDLEAKGHKFKTRSDTEVILHGYEEYGSGVFSLLNGMFAIALWDIEKRRLVLARDRVGIKPLYYAKASNGDLVFCSEVKGILAHNSVQAKVNTEGLYCLMSLYYIPFEHTLFQGIQKIPPGHYFESDKEAVFPYWSAPILKDGFAPEPKTVLNALEQSVKRQLVSDVEVGAFLSGGLDSSSIVCFASKHYSKKLKTFCMGFGHPNDELDSAKKVADFFGTDHFGFTITDSATLEMYPQMIWHSEQPKLNTYSWFVNEFARKYVKVSLSGLGGDELFFGYPTSSRFIAFHKAQRLMKIPGSSLLSVLTSGKRRQVIANLKKRSTAYLTTVSPIFGTLDKKIFSIPITDYQSYLDKRVSESFFGDVEDFVQQSFRAEFLTKLPDDFLAIDDSMSMAHSLENRVPLLDNQLLDLMLPVSYEYNYENQVGKALLRRAMKGLLPEECFDKPKQGFSLNVVNWWKGELGEEIRNTISDSLVVDKYFNKNALLGLFPSADGSYSLVSLLWTVYAFHIWHNVFVDRSNTNTRPASPNLHAV
jgi:asparagine synthase (glutamine-hydrolysing)